MSSGLCKSGTQLITDGRHLDPVIGFFVFLARAVKTNLLSENKRNV